MRDGGPRGDNAPRQQAAADRFALLLSLHSNSRAISTIPPVEIAIAQIIENQHFTDS